MLLAQHKSPIVCVIGGGPSGLTVAKNLAERGIRFDCLEREEDIGGVWNPQTSHGRVHASTSMISSKRLTEFTDFRMPREYPHYPRHDQALRYLRSYANQFDLLGRIRFGQDVERIERNGSGWNVKTSGNDHPSRYDMVVIANGHHRTANMPSWNGHFSGEVIHAEAYKNAEILKGRRVLLIGAGNSGCDIAVEAAQHASSAALSMRRGYHVFPKYVFGAPIDRCAATLDRWHVPWWLTRWITHACLRVAVGPLSRYGLPQPDHRLLESHPIVNSQFLHFVAHRRLEIKPAIQSVDGNTVRFEDGSAQDVDLIVCATGYKVSFPFCEEGTFDWEGDRPALFLNAFHPARDNLFFAGLIQPTGGIWQLVDYQAQLIARFICAQSNQTPSADWFRKVKTNHADDGRGGVRFIDSPRHALEVEYFRYKRRLQKLIAEFDRRDGR